MLNAWNLTDFSNDDDNTGAAAIIESESENEVEIDPYSSKIKTDELQEIGKPMEVLFSDTDSIPNLESVVTLSNEETGEPGKLTTFLMELLLDKIVREHPIQPWPLSVSMSCLEAFPSATFL